MPWRGPEEPGEFPTLGYLAADWIEQTLPITDGPKAGQPFRLYDEQVLHLLHRYRLDPGASAADGNDAFRFRGSMLVRGQKWGKDPLLAAIDLFHAFGPCDFAGWDAHGDPVGRPHPSPWVFVAALNDRQTDNTWLPLKAMVEQSELADLSGVEVNLDQIRLPCGNPIEPLTTTAFGRLGGRFTAGSLTENGLMTATGGDGGSGKRSPLGFARTLIRSVAGMGGMWSSATNTWDPTEMSHAQQVYDARGKTVYVDARLSRRKVSLDDDEGLLEELSYLYGDSARERGGHVSVTSLVRDCQDEANGENEIRRFFLSEIIAGEKDAVNPTVWDAQARDSDLVAGEAVALGFDGSRTRDGTALVASRLSDGRLFVLGFWRRPLGAPADWKVPREEVHAAVKSAFDVYDVYYLYADPYLWQDALATWSGLWPDKIVDFPTNVEQRMDRAIERFLTALREGELTHDGNAALAEHAMNTSLVKGRRKPPRDDAETGARVEFFLKYAKKRAGLIDLMVAATLAYEARGQAVEAGALNEKEVEPWLAYL